MTTPSPPQPRAISAKYRLAKVVFAATALVLVVAPLAVVTWLFSSSGERFVLSQIKQAAADQLDGRLEIESLGLSGFLEIELRGVQLFAPGDERPVVAIRRVSAQLDLPALVSRRIEVTNVRIEEPAVRFEQDANGSNLSRAVALRHPSTEIDAKSSSRPWGLRLPSIALRDGRISVTGIGPQIAADKLALDASLSGSVVEFNVDASLSAHVQEPASRPFELKTSMVVSTEHLKLGELSMTLGESNLTANGALQFDISSASIAIERLRVSPDDVAAFAPDVTLLAPVQATGTASLDAGTARTKLRLSLPEGSLNVAASAGIDFDADPLITRWDAAIELNDVQPQALLADLPEMNLDASLGFTNGVGMPGQGTADVLITGRRLRYEQLPIENLSIRGTVDALAINAKALSAVAAGVRLQAFGTFDASQANITAKAEVASVSKTRHALERGLGLTLPGMTGSAKLDVLFKGAWAQPTVKATGRIPTFATEDVSIKDADFSMQLEQWTPNLKVSGHLAARDLSSGDLHGRDLRVTAAMDGKKVKLSVDGDLGNTKVVVRADARRQQSAAGVQRWRIEELRADALDIQMAATQASFVEIINQRVNVAPLTISGDLGALTLSGSGGSSGPVKASIAIDALRFERIPQALLPTDVKLAGTMKGTIDVAGTVAAPTVDAHLALTGARLNEVSPINATLDASMAKGRLVAHLNSDIGGARAVASVDLPLQAPAQSAKKPSPISASLKLEGVTPALLAALVPELPELKGTARADVSLAGTWAVPSLEARLSVDKGGMLPVGGVDVEIVASYKNDVVTVSGTGNRTGYLDTSFDLKMPLASRPLLAGHAPPWRTLAPTGEVRLTRLSLPWLETMGFLPEGTLGTAAGRVLFGGTAHRPEVSATLAARGVVWENHRGIDATADLRVLDAVDFTLGAQIGNEPVLQASASAKASSTQLMEMDTAKLWQIPTTVDVRLLPTPLSRLLGTDSEPVAEGVASASVSATGTPDDPRLTIEALVDEIKASNSPALGRFVVDGRYDGTHSRVSARFDSKNAGTIVALAIIPGQLSARALASAEGIDALLARRAEVSLTTSGFDLALIDGLSSDVRDVAGRLNLRFKKSGPLLEPGGEGSLEMRGVKAAFLDYGEITDTELDAVFAWPSFKLRSLKGRSGSGKFDARADLASSDGGESFKGSVHAELDKLPLVQHFETKGWLSLVVDASLELRDGWLSVSPLVLSKGLLKVGDVNVTRQLTGQGKDIQSLDRNDDIVFLSELRAQRRKREKAALRAQKKPDAQPLRTDIRLSVPNDFVIDAPLGNKLTLGANVKVTVDPARSDKELDPVDVEGRVNVVKGTVNVLRRFDISKGQLTFRPNQWKDPDVDIEAKHEGSDGTVVTVAFGGTTNHLTKRFQLLPGDGEPATNDEAEVLFYLTTGRRQARANTTTPDLNEALATAGMNALGSLGVSGVKWIAQNLLPLPDAFMPDVLSVDTDLRNGLAGSIERVRAGKYISDRIYIGGQYNREANLEQNESFFEVEGSYRLSDETALKLRAAQGHYGAEVTYQKDFPTKKQRTATERK